MSKALVTLQSRFLAAVEGKKDRGATMVEYGIMVALIAAVCIGVVVTIGTQILGAFNTVTGSL